MSCGVTFTAVTIHIRDHIRFKNKRFRKVAGPVEISEECMRIAEWPLCKSNNGPGMEVMLGAIRQSRCELTRAKEILKDIYWARIADQIGSGKSRADADIFFEIFRCAIRILILN